jgi:hypothetical protein
VTWELRSPIHGQIGSRESLATIGDGAFSVELRGMQESIEALTRAISATQKPSGRLGYRCVFVGPSGFFAGYYELDAPGLASMDDVDAVERMAGPGVCLISHSRIEPAVNKAEKPQAIGVPS